MKWNLSKYLRFNSTFLSLLIHLLILLALIFLLPSPSPKSSIGERATGEVGLVYSTQPGPRDETPSDSSETDSSVTNVDQIISQHQDNLKPQETNVAADLPRVIGPSGVVSEAVSELGGSVNPGSGAAGKSGGGESGRSGVVGQFMGAEGKGSKFIYVLDRSSSTSIGGQNSPLAIAKRELSASLAGLLELGDKEGKLIQFQIIFFNNKTEIYNERKKTGKLPILDDQSLGLAQRYISSIVPAGGTDSAPALVAALQERGDVIFFLTDGETKLTSAELDRLQRLSYGEQINVIEYGTKPKPTTPNSLQQLARNHHGTYHYVDIRKYRK